MFTFVIWCVGLLFAGWIVAFLCAAMIGLLGKIQGNRIKTGWTTQHYVDNYGPKQYICPHYEKEICDDLYRRGYY